MTPRVRKLYSRNDVAPTATLEPPTFETVQRERIVDRLRQYRELVAKAASGPVSAVEMGQAGDLLAVLGLPLSQWSRDLEAYRDHAHTAAEQAKVAANREADEARAAELTATIKRLEAELAEARSEHYAVSHVRAMTRVGLAQRLNELGTTHAHLFRDIDEAADMRLSVRSQSSTGNSSPLGWH